MAPMALKCPLNRVFTANFGSPSKHFFRLSPPFIRIDVGMRRIGTIADGEHSETLARRFSDYLVTLSIDSSVESDGQGGWDLWVKDEERVSDAKEALGEFLSDPDAEKYQVSGEANRIRDEKIQANRRRLETQRKMQQKLSRSSGRGAMGAGGMGSIPGSQQGIPVTIGLILISICVSFGANFFNPKPSQIPGQLSLQEKIFVGSSFVDPREYTITRDPLASLKRGEIWRLVTPFFLHGDPFHLAFNMIWVYILGSVIERLHGSVRLLTLVIVTGVVGNALQVALPSAASLPSALSGLAGSPFALGFSGAVYGLFGFLWVRPMIDAFYPVRISPRNVMLMLGWLVFCIFGLSGIANGAHIGGLLAGVAMAWLIPKHLLGDSA